MQNKALKILLLTGVWLVISAASFCQSNYPVVKLFGRILKMGDPHKAFAENPPVGHFFKPYQYDIFHLAIETSRGDTMIIGMVYHLRNDLEKLTHKFGLMKDSTYIFTMAECTPCRSDFPMIKNCSFSETLDSCLYKPGPSRIVSQSYFKIFRILEYSRLYQDIWEELIRMERVKDNPVK